MATRVAPAAAVEHPSAYPLRIPATALAGAIAAAWATWFTWDTPLVGNPHAVAISKGVLVASYAAVGAYTWWQRPSSRLGPLVIGAGLVATLTALGASEKQLPFTVGRVMVAAGVVYFIWLFACFPHDRLVSRLERRLVRAAVGTSAIVWVIVLAFADKLPHGGPLTDCTRNCPDNPLGLVDTSHAVTSAINFTANLLTAILIVALIALLVRKARDPARLRQRAVAPLLYAAILFTATYAAYSVIRAAGEQPVANEFTILFATGAFAVPLALLIGQARGRIFATTNFFRVLGQAKGQRVTPGWVQEFLGGTLGDPTLELGIWSPDRAGYLDVRGQPFDLPETSVARSVSRIEKAGRPSIALIHDSSLNDQPGLVDGLGATAVMLLENAVLVDELQASRARIVDSAERERVRLERDLHDGAQARLIAIQVKLAVAQESAAGGELAALLDELADDAAAAVEELRMLAHGIYPTVLHERGIGDALQAFATMAPIPVRVIDRGVGRASPGTEAGVYYCVLEALQNAVKHAGQGARVIVTLSRDTDVIAFEVRDDGAGFDPTSAADGIGIVSMRDRIGAVGGSLLLDSSPGAGTIVSGSAPVGG